MDITALKQQIEQQRGRFNQLKKELGEYTDELMTLSSLLKLIDEARVLIQLVAQQTQQQLEYVISDIVTLALSIVFDDPYSFKVEFVLRRGKVECDLWFERGGQLVHPLDASGGGTVDIAALALRLSLWALLKNTPVIIIDEPFKHLSKNLHPRASTMLKELSSKLGLQIIMVSHSDDLITDADRVFEVTMKDRVSKVAIL